MEDSGPAAEPGPAEEGPDHDDDDTTVVVEEEVAESALPEQLRGPIDPGRIELSPQEQRWALDIKKAIQRVPHLDAISDFMCAQLALVEKGNVADALQRVYIMQEYRKEYHILDSVAQGQRHLSTFLERTPGFCLSFFYSDPQDRYVTVADFTKLNPQVFATLQDIHNLHLATYYYHQATFMDLASVRNGVIEAIEWEGFLSRIPEMMNHHFFRLLYEDVCPSYPHHFHKIKHFHTGVFVNVMLSMGKRFVPKSMQSKFVLGCHSHARLDNLCNVPNAEVASELVERALLAALRRRYEAESIFRL